MNANNQDNPMADVRDPELPQNPPEPVETASAPEQETVLPPVQQEPEPSPPPAPSENAPARMKTAGWWESVDTVAKEEPVQRDEDVFGDVVGYGFSDEEMQRYFRAPEWRPARQQAHTPAPLLPQQQEEKNTYWRNLLSGNIQDMPNEIRKKILGESDDLSEDEQDYRLYAAVNRSWAADYLGAHRQTIQSAWPQYRARLARRLEVADTDEDVFLALSERESEKPLREAGVAAYTAAYGAGIEGKETYEIEGLLGKLNPAHADNARGLALRAYEEGTAARRKYMPLAKLIRDGLETFVALDEDSMPAPGVLEHAPRLVTAVRELAQLNHQERDTVLQVTRSLLSIPQPDEELERGVVSTVLQALRRSSANSGMDFAQGLAQMSRAGMRLMGRGKNRVSQTVGTWAEQVDKYSIIFEELRRLAQNEWRPLEPEKTSGWAGQLMVDMSSAVPEVVYSFLKHPIVGMILNTRDVGRAAMDVRMRAPEADADVALTAGALGLLIQRQVESSISKIGGDKLNHAISRLVRQRGRGMKRFVLNGAGVTNAFAFELLRELLAGKAGQAAGLLTQESVMKCRRTAANIDWQQFGHTALDVNLNMREAAAELPFILLGAGRVALRDFTAPQYLLRQEGAALKSWGVSDAERKKIVAETDIDKQGEMLRQALSKSPRWGGADFLPRAARALRLLHFNYFTEFKDKEFLCDFLNLPPTSRYTNEQATPQPTPPPPADVLNRGVFSVQNHADADYQKQVMELWHDEWKKAHYLEEAPHVKMARGWDLLSLKTPSQKRLAVYLDEISGSPRMAVPRRIQRSGVYAPFAEVERKLLLRDRVEDVRHLSHLFALHALSLDSSSPTPVPVSEMRKHAESARQNYLGTMVGAVLRIRNGEDRDDVCHEVESQILRDFHDNLYSLSNTPLWLLGLDPRGFDALPHYMPNGVNTWRHWLRNPDMIDVYRICAGTRANIRVLSDLLPLTSDYYSAIARNMTPLQACRHLLLRELPCAVDNIPNYPHEELELQISPARFDAFCQENTRLFTLCERMFGAELLQDTAPQGYTLWAARRPDGSQSPWHRTKQQAINDYVTNAQTYFQEFDMRDLALDDRLRTKKESYMGQAYNWLSSQNPFIGHDQVFSHASRDMLQWMDERAAFLQPGLVVNRTPNHFYPGDEASDDGLSPLFSKADAAAGRYDVNHFTIVSPIAYLQSRSRVFWERMMASNRVSEEQVENFVRHVESDFPKVKSMLHHYFRDPNVESLKSWSQSRESMLANKMSVYSTCYILAHPQELDLPESVRLWLKLTPLCPVVNDEKPRGEEWVEQRRSIPRGWFDAALMTWVNRKTSEKLRRLTPLLESLRQKPFFRDKTDATMRKLFNISMGKDPIQQLEQGWMQLLCGEEVLRRTPQRWFNLLHSPLTGWKTLGEYEQEHLAQFMAPLVRRGEELGMGERDFNEHVAELNDKDRLELALGELDDVLARHPELRRYGYVDPHVPFASMLMVDKKKPGLERLDEPVYTGLPLYAGEQVVGCSVVPYGKFEFNADAPPEVTKALELMSRLRMYPITRPICKGGRITWNGVEYGGRHGKTPHRTDHWKIVDNPLESLLQMREKIEKLEQLGQEDTVANFDLLCNGVLPATHRQVYGNITVYRDPVKVLNISRLMPGEPFARHGTVTNPYVVQCNRGAYIIQRKMADSLELMGQAMQPLEKFRPWGNQNRGERRNEEGRLVAIRRNLTTAVRQPFDYNIAKTPINVSPREMFMRLAVDTGFLDTLNNVQPHQMDYGSSLTYHLVNALYEYSCHPEISEVRGTLADITSRLRTDDEDFKLVFRVLRESSRRTTHADPIMPLFNWLNEGDTRESTDRVWVNPDELDETPDQEMKLPVIKVPRAMEIKRLEIGEDMDFAPVDVDESELPPLELMQFDFSEQEGSPAGVWHPQKIGDPESSTHDSHPVAPPPNVLRGQQSPPSLMRPVDTHDHELWGDLFQFKFSGPHARPTKKEDSSHPHGQLPLDFGDDEP